EVPTPRPNIAVLQLGGQQAVDLALRNPMMTAGRFGCLDLAAIDPLLQRRVADRQNIRRFPRCQKFLRYALRTQEHTIEIASLIRFYTFCEPAAPLLEGARSQNAQFATRP